MEKFVIVTVAGWFLIATATAQHTNKPPIPPNAPSQSGMPGMDMSQQGPDPDMKSMPGMKMDGSAAPSEQQSMPGMNMGTGTEDQTLRTDASSPAPELLKEVAARPARKLAEFLNLADAKQPNTQTGGRDRAKVRSAGHAGWDCIRIRQWAIRGSKSGVVPMEAASRELTSLKPSCLAAS